MTDKPNTIYIDYVTQNEASNTPANNSIETLAFTHWQYIANEKAYKEGLITRGMYEYARDELQKSIDKLSSLCYNNADSR